MSSAETSAISLLSILKWSASFLSRVPLHSGHTLSCTKRSFRSIDSSLSFPVCSSLAMTPGNGASWVPSARFTLKRSFVPYMIAFRTSSGRLPTGSLSENSIFLAMLSSILNQLLSLYEPNGWIAPSSIDFVVSGIIFARSICATYPRPLHFGQAP